MISSEAQRARDRTLLFTLAIAVAITPSDERPLCQVINASPANPSGAIGPFYPGNAPSAQGSVFAEPGGVFTNGGTGGTQYNLVGAPSQYDVACYQMSQKP